MLYFFSARYTIDKKTAPFKLTVINVPARQYDVETEAVVVAGPLSKYTKEDLDTLTGGERTKCLTALRQRTKRIRARMTEESLDE